MIHILDYKNSYFDYNPDILLQYVDVTRIFQKFISESNFIKKQLEKDGQVIYKRVDDNDKFTVTTFCKYINENNDINILVCNIDIFKDCYIIPNSFFSYISKKYPNIKFIVSSDETFMSYSNIEYNHKNIFYILNRISKPYSFVKNVNILNNFASYYTMNNYLQEEYVNFLQKLFYTSNDVVRDKKYNFYNGVHKPHRLKSYELIKKCDLLDEGYFSYANFAHMTENEETDQEFMHFFGFKTKEEYKKYLSAFEIPRYYDTIESDPNVFVAFANPPQTSLQSYVSITTETTFHVASEIYDMVLSEKAFKPFYGFNIPLIIGTPIGIQYLKDLGFDLFEDLFDVTPKSNKKELFEQVENNFKVIKSMTKLELHDYYIKNMDRLNYNFELLTKILKERDLENLNNFFKVWSKNI
jgi:hypothetical protein